MGYACGLAAMSNGCTAVEYALVGDGLSLKDLRDAGAEAYDLERIAEALRPNTPTTRLARLERPKRKTKKALRGPKPTGETT